MAVAGWIVLAIVVGLQAMPFIEGYRRTADEVAFLDVWTQGWEAVAGLAGAAAVHQGRLGFLVLLPLNALGAYLSDAMTARVVFVALHFGVFALFAVYFSLVSASRTAKALLLLLVTLQPLCRANEHMPPISYPLQNSLPFLCLLAARCLIIAGSPPRGRGRPAWLWPAYILFILAMMTTEYAFLLATSMLAAEYGFALARPDGQRAPIGVRLGSLLGQRRFWIDAACVALVLTTYLGFRWLYPSTYDGNVLDGAGDIGRVLATTARHVWAGTMFSRDWLAAASAPFAVWMVAGLIGVVSAGGFFLWLPHAISLRAPAAVAAGCLVAILYVSFPLAANAKQQVWCLEHGACGYLDSRLSYLAFCVILISAMAWLLQRRFGPWPVRAAAVGVISLALGAIGAVAFASNWQRGQVMRAEAVAWTNAVLLACQPDRQPSSDDLLLRMIDPLKRVPFHPGIDRASYWRRHLAYLARTGRCGEAAADGHARVQALGPALARGQTVHFQAGAGGDVYLGPGWSQPEAPGVWSDGARAELLVLPRGLDVTGPASLIVRFTPYFGPSVMNQTVDVYVNGTLTQRWVLAADRPEDRTVERRIELPRDLGREGLVTITFGFSQPRDPGREPGSPETRRLGILLSAITLSDRN